MNKSTAVYLAIFLVISIGSCAKDDSSSTGKNITAELQYLPVSSTDSNIQYDPSENHIYRECDNGQCTDDLLFVFFPGTDASPSANTKIADVIGETGVRVLILAYQNNNSINSLCVTNDSCYTMARQDRVEGSASSDYVSSVNDGVKNRILKALQALNWAGFYTGSTINWSKLIVGGFSQGAGVAAWIGKHYAVHRVCQFSGTWDHTSGTTSASWLSEYSVTPGSSFYGFTHLNDSVPNGAFYLDINWQALGMGANSIQLYSDGLMGQKIYADDNDSNCVANYHACSVEDSATPVLADGTPKYANVWKYVCGR
jgi:hypothetical protein